MDIDPRKIWQRLTSHHDSPATDPPAPPAQSPAPARPPSQASIDAKMQSFYEHHAPDVDHGIFPPPTFVDPTGQQAKPAQQIAKPLDYFQSMAQAVQTASDAVSAITDPALGKALDMAKEARDEIHKRVDEYHERRNQEIVAAKADWGPKQFTSGISDAAHDVVADMMVASSDRLVRAVEETRAHPMMYLGGVIANPPVGLVGPALVSEERKQIPEVQARAAEQGGGILGWSKAVNDQFNPANGIFEHGEKAIDAGKRGDWRSAGKETTHTAVSVAQTMAVAEAGAGLLEGAGLAKGGAKLAKAEGAATREAAPREASVAKAEGAAAREAVHGQEVLAKVREVNKVNKGVPLKDQENCIRCSIAADKTLGGSPASALGGGPFELPVLRESYPGRKAVHVSGYGEIETIMRKAGPGSRGIVLVDRYPTKGHVFNVVNHKGTVVLVDAQTGRVGDLPAYKHLFLLRTN